MKILAVLICRTFMVYLSRAYAAWCRVRKENAHVERKLF